MAKNSGIIIVLFAALFSSQACLAQTQCSSMLSEKHVEVRAFEASQTLSQKIRDNAPHYWDYVRKNSNLYFKNFVHFEGLVVGDTHAGNFIVSPLAGKMQFFIADIKDAGQAPFIFDVSRLVVSTHAYLKGNVKLGTTADTLLSAYKMGVSGANYKVPKSIRWIFEETMQDYRIAEQDYVSGKVKNKKFKLNSDKLQEISFRYSEPARYNKLKTDIEKSIQQSLPGSEVLDLAFRPRERGGSVEMARYWALVRTGGQMKIFEFKQVSIPSTEYYGAQQEVFSRYERIFETFWQTLDPLFKLTTLEGDIYLMRPKKSDVFRVKYKGQSDKDIEFGLQLAAYDAYYLGMLHGRQLKDDPYSQALEKKSDLLLEEIKVFTKDYIDNLKESLSSIESEAS